MKYKATVELVPTAPFGLPDGDSIVYPVSPDGNPVRIHFPAFDTVSKHFTNWGTLSRYRLEEDAIDIQYQFKDYNVHFKDNFVNFVFKAQNEDGARKVGYELSSSLTHCLTYFLGIRFDFNLFKLEELEAEKKTLPNINRLKLKSTTYDLRALHNQLSDILVPCFNN